MSLIKTNVELKTNFSSIDKDYNIASLQSFIDDAEQDIVIPWIGQAIYDVAAAAYNALPGVQYPDGSKLPQLMFYLQKAVTHLAFMLAADSGSFKISDTGYYVISNTNNKPVSDKKMSEFKKGRRESGYRALEQAIEFMEVNIDDASLAAYAASDQHAFHRSYFINSSVDFTRYYKKVNNSAYLFWQMTDALDYAERNYIAPLLGQDYFDTLKELIFEADLSIDQKKLLPYINKALANLTMAKALVSLPLEFDGTGVVIRSQPTKGNSDVAENLTPANAAQLSLMADDALNTGNMELRNLSDYLLANAESLPGYTKPVADPTEAVNDLDINDECSPNFFV